MAKKKDDFSYEIKDVISVITESPSSDWAKCIVRMQYEGMEETIDFRNINPISGKIGKGVSFKPDELDIITDALLDAGYGSMDAMKEAYKRHVSRFTVGEVTDDDIFDEDGYLVCKLGGE